MPQVFDPSKSMNALAGGMNVGSHIRDKQTMNALAPMVADGRYDEAMKYAGSRGSLEMMDYVRPQQQAASEKQTRMGIGGALAAGDTSGAMGIAYGAGDLDTGMKLYGQQRTEKNDAQADYRTGIKRLSDRAGEIMQFGEDDPRRAQLAMQIAQDQGDPQFIAAVQQAVADGRLTDVEIQSFQSELMTVMQQNEQSNWQATYDQSGDQFTRTFDQRAGFHDDNLALEQASLAETRRSAKAGEAAASATSGGGLAPGLHGLPTGVQGNIVSNDLKGIDKITEATDISRELVMLGEEWLRQAEGYGAQGGGFFADVGQAFSQKTNPLKGLTETMVMLQKKPGTGTMTDDDAARAQKATLNINQSKEANEQVLRIYKASDQNNQEHQLWLREAQTVYGFGSGGRAQQEWLEYSRAHPVYNKITGEPIVNRPSISKWLAAQNPVTEEGGGAENVREGAQVVDGAENVREGALVQDENGVKWRKQNGQMVRVD